AADASQSYRSGRASPKERGVVWFAMSCAWSGQHLGGALQMLLHIQTVRARSRRTREVHPVEPARRFRQRLVQRARRVALAVAVVVHQEAQRRGDRDRRIDRRLAQMATTVASAAARRERIAAQL